MDFSRGISIQEGQRLKVQGGWVPSTPAKPIPTRPHTIMGETCSRPIWFDSVGLPAEFLQRNPSTSNAVAACLNSAPSFDQHRDFNNWEPDLTAKKIDCEPTLDTYAQAMNNGNPMAMWNSLPFQDLLALANASASVSQREGNNVASRPYFPFSLPENDNNQLRSNSTNMFAEQNYSINSTQRNGSNHPSQMPQYGLPVCCSSTYDLNSAPRTMYDLNSSPSTIVDAVSNGNISFPLAPVTPEKSTRLQHNQHSGGVSNDSMSFQFASGAPDVHSRMQHKQPFDALSNGISSFQLAHSLPENVRKMQHKQPFDASVNDVSSFQLAHSSPENVRKMQHHQLLEVVSNNSAPFQFPPSTPDKGSKMQHNQPSEVVNNAYDERIIQLENKLQGNAEPKGSNFFELHSSQESCLSSVVNSSPPALEKPLQPVDSICADLSTPSKEKHQPETGENGIDLNKTPQPKPRRKKHRPRVVREGKAKGTPKSTVKQSNVKETPRVKRKYVRRKGVNTSNIPSSDAVGGNNNASQRPVRSCKRSLNFDSDGQGHESQGETSKHQEEIIQSNLNNLSSHFTFNNISESQVAELCTRNKESTGTTSLQYSLGLEEMVQNSLADVAFDLNQSATQTLGDYISLPEITPSVGYQSAQNLSQPTRRELLRENLKALSRDCQNNRREYPQEINQTDSFGNHEDSVPSRLQSSMYPVSQNQSSVGCSHHPALAENRQETVSKRAHSQTIDEGQLRSFNLIGTHFNSLKVYQEMFRGNDDLRNRGMLFPEIYKKRRTGKSQNTTASKSHMATVGDDQREVTTHHSENANRKFSTSQWASVQICNTSCKLSPSQGISSNQCNANSSESLKIGGSARTDEYSSLSSELMLTIRQTEMKTRKRSKAHTRVRDLSTLTSVTQCNNMQSPPPRNARTSQDRRVIETFQGTQYNMQSPSVDNNAKMPISKRSMKGSNGNMVPYSSANDMRLKEHQGAIYGYRHYSTKSRGSMEVVRQVNSPMDDLVQRLSSLSISAERNMLSANKENALIQFKGDGRVVRYEGVFDPIKKRRPRPKVDLDTESDRVWKLLMGKEADEEDERANAHNEKWWEEERRVFRGRAESFIARMHLIQGDRRFTRWNGSVLDSVIGVFLTQNVSDHLSSSAFMSLAARFPLKPTNSDITHHEEETRMYVEEPEMGVLESRDIKWHEKMSPEPVRSQDTQGSVTICEADHIDDKEMGNSSESFESNTGDGCSSGNSPKTKAGILQSGIVCPSFLEADDGRLLEVESSGISPQNSVDSPLFQETVGNTITSNGDASLLEAGRRASEDVVSCKTTTNSFSHKRDEVIRSCSDSNSEGEDPTVRCKPNSLNSSTSFTELLHTTMFPDYYNPGTESLSIDLNSQICYNQSEHRDSQKRLDLDTNAESNSFSHISLCSKFLRSEAPSIPFSNGCMQVSSDTGVLDVPCPGLIGEQSSTSSPLTGSNEEKKDVDNMGRVVPMEETMRERIQENRSLNGEAAGVGVDVPYSWGSNQLENNRTCPIEGDQSNEPKTVKVLGQRRNNRIHQASLNSLNSSGETLGAVESTLMLGKKDSIENTDAESVVKEHGNSSKLSTETTSNTSKPNGKSAREKKKAVDWDYLRKEAYQKCGKREKNPDTVDSLDWEAVRCADVNEIAKAIKERGMNNMLAERIKDFLNRLVREHENLNLEWLRDVPPDKVKEYLLSVRGLGLKSVECVRLLTLHHLAFPVDTNVGRIAVRLGWVPLQPLPESLQLHLLEMYPVLETIQKYLWPRLCKLDQRTLYELHYQLITFGKVFCTKSKPNCNACPMRAECKHFASAFASARLNLTGPEEKGIVSSTISEMHNQSPAVGIHPMSLPPPQASILSETSTRIVNSEPIIEVPASPEPEITESDIEDAFYEDPDEIPTIKLNVEDFALNLQNYMQANNMELQDGDVSKALVALNPNAASIPTPKLKNVGRLRTEHLVYELPDSHPLLKGVDKRVPGEVCSYLLAIWTPGETAESIQEPERCCDLQMSGNLCSEKTCFSCNSRREAHSQTVRGTLLIPSKTANRGSFPLNGTYFQVNEVFADHDSSLNPIDVPRAWLWNLHRRTVYFGTSIPTIFKGQSTEEIQSCFWRGYVCVRGFDQKTRAPRPLMARLHFPASKLAENQRKMRPSNQ